MLLMTVFASIFFNSKFIDGFGLEIFLTLYLFKKCPRL